MAATVAFDQKLQGVKTFQSAIARGLKLGYGTIDLSSSSTYADGGVTCSFAGFRDVIFAHIDSPSGYYVEWRKASTVAVVRNLSFAPAEFGNEIASDVSLASWTAVPFFVVGT